MKKLPEIDRSTPNRIRRHSLQEGWCLGAARMVIAVVIRALLRLYTRFEIVGHENVRTNRSLIMVANHASHLDAVCLLAALPLHKLDRAFAAAAEDYFFRSLSRKWIASIVVNALPFARQHHIRESLELCRDLLGQPGTILIIFPEGTRATDGRIQEFRSGIGALAAGRDVSVVPCYLEGTARVWPKGTYFFRPRKVRLIIGRPRHYGSRSRAEAALIASELREAVLALRNGL